jgi:hypothetical protein
MLHAVYGVTQNYAKTPYEIHSHLTEVCGIYARHQFKRRDPKAAEQFLPKIFAWAVALLKKVRSEKSDLEEIILRKFPNACPYCGASACSCWEGLKPTLDQDLVRALYYRNQHSIRRSANDFQAMFRRIYGETWAPDGANSSTALRHVFLRLIEELAELAESIRFQHLYPVNFENEIADFFAW